MSESMKKYLSGAFRRIVVELERLAGKEHKPPIDVHAHDDWTHDLLAIHQAVIAHSGNTYTELWRRFSEHLKAGRTEQAYAARATGIRLTERLANFHAELRAEFPEGIFVIGDRTNRVPES